MPDAVEHGKLILAGIIPGRPDRLEQALKHLSEDHFVDQTQKTLWRYLVKAYSITGAVFRLKNLDDLISKTGQQSKYLLVRELMEECEEVTPASSDFIWSLRQIRVQMAERRTKEAIQEASKILINPDEEVEGTPNEQARSFLAGELADIERADKLAESPEGTLNEEATSMWKEYAERKKLRESGNTSSIRFGISELDKIIGGCQPGELVMTIAASGEGKSTLAVQMAWSAAVEQKKNVVFFSTETVREQIRRKLIARHSKHPKFELPNGINSRDLKDGTLSADDEEALKVVLKDFEENKDYGRIHIVQVPRSATVFTLESSLRRLQTMFDIDLVVMDYLALLTPEKKRGTMREELADILKEAKRLATTFNNGKGVPFISPWQVTRAAREEAEKVGRYTSRALSETAEATNSADMIVSLLAPLENSDRRAELTMQVIKNRDGETADSLLVEVDYATGQFRSRQAVKPVAMVPGSSMMFGGM